MLNMIFYIFVAHAPKNQENLENNRQNDLSKNINESFKCLKCGKLFAKRHELNFHMKTHKIYECTECSAIFKSSKDKKNHIESEHPRMKEETQQRDIGELQGVLAIRGLGFRGFAIRGFLKP